MDDEEVAGQKYAYLLQPVRDFQKLFDVDIAKLLEEYQQKINAVAEEEEFLAENAHRFNFAEAAMLIQGSTMVFARKIDAVYNEAMDFFSTLKDVDGKKKKKGSQHNDDDEGFADDDDGGGSVGHTMDPCVLQECWRMKPASYSSITLKVKMNNTIPTISVMPMSLMPLAEYEKCEVPMYARNNAKEVIGKKDDYKINTGYLDISGALLLDLLNKRLLKNFASDEFMQVGVATDLDKNGNDDSGMNSPGDDPDDLIDNAPAANIATVPTDPAGATQTSEYNVIEMNRRETDGVAMRFDLDNRPSTVLLHAPVQSAKDALDFSNYGEAADLLEDDTQSSEIIPPNAWDFNVDIDPLDHDELEENMFEDTKWQYKPLHVIKCSMDTEAIVKRRRNQEKKRSRDEKMMELLNYLNERVYMRSMRQKAAADVLKDNHWDAIALFPYIVKNKRAKKKTTAPTKEATSKKTKGAQSRADNATAAPCATYWVDDDDAGGAYADEELEMGNMGQNVAAVADLEDVLNEDPNISIALFEDQDNNEDHMDVDGPPPTNDWPQDPMNVPLIPGDDMRPPSNMTSKDIFDHYFTKYWKSAMALSSRLAVRVSEWEQQMMPVLEEELTRKEFDIHDYGSHLLDLFVKSGGSNKQLAELMRGKRDYEISRYFLSCLMMANTYNLEIVPEEYVKNTLTSMELKLLKTTRHHEVFDQEGAL